MSEPSGRCVQLSLPHFTPVIFHPNAPGAPASDWDAAAEEHAAPERTGPTPPAIPSTTMRARRKSGHVVAEMFVAATGFVTLAVRQTIAQPDFLHTNDTAAGHNQTSMASNASEQQTSSSNPRRQGAGPHQSICSSAKFVVCVSPSNSQHTIRFKPNSI
jgi:hypothetical protein